MTPAQAMTDMAPKLGGLVEFYRSPARVAWTPTGGNVPDCRVAGATVVEERGRGRDR